MSDGAPAYPERTRAWWWIVVLFFASIVSVLDRGILNIVVDPVRASLALSDVQISLLQGFAFGLFYATVGLPLGLTADRHSRRGLIIASVAVWSVATIAAGLAQSFGWLFLARILVGLGEAGLSPAAVSLIADLFPPERRGRPIGIFLTGQAVANGLAISTTSWIITSAAAGRFAGVPGLAALEPWRVAFICCGATGFVVVAALLTTREAPRRRNSPGIQVGQQALAGLGYLAANARVFVPLYLGFSCCFIAAYGAAAWAPTMLLRAFGATPAYLGQWLGPLSMAFAVIGPTIGGTLVDRCARTGDPLRKFLILIVAPLCAIPAALAVFAPRLGIAIVMVASSAAVFAVIGTSLLTTLQSIVAPEMRGLGVALTGLSNTLLAGTSGPLLMAALTEHLFRKPELVGLSIASVAVPALIAGSLLFAFAARALREQQRGGGGAARLMAELELQG